MKDSLKIIRTASGCLSAISLIEELRNSGVYVIGTDCDPLSVGLELCDKGYVVPRGDNENFIDEMLKICKTEKPDAIISGPEEEIINLSKNKDKFDDLGVLLLCPDYESVQICMDKIKTNQFLQNLNIPVPRIYDNISKLKYPCIIKPNPGRGGRGIHILEDKKDLNHYYKKVKNPIIQEFVKGEEYSIDAFADMNGNVLSVVPRKRILTESGISVKGITVNDKNIIKYAKKIVEELKLFGPACIQCIKDEKGTPKFIEINPRFGGGSILSIKADPLIIPNLLKIIREEKTNSSDSFKEDLVMIRYFDELFIDKSQVKYI